MVFIVWTLEGKSRHLLSCHATLASALTCLRLEADGGKVNEDAKPGRIAGAGWGIIRATGERADGVRYAITQHSVEN